MTEVLSIDFIFSPPLVDLIRELLPLLVEGHHLQVRQKVSLVLHEVESEVLKWKHA